MTGPLRLKLWIAAILILGSNPSLAIQDQMQHLSLSDREVTSGFSPRRLGLFIGINHFSDASYAQLKYATKDVDDLTKFLRQHNDTQQDELIVIKNEKATLANIEAALDRLERMNTSEHDIIVVYLSTHGTLAYDDRHHLARYAVTADTIAEQVPKSGIAIDYLQVRLNRLVSTRKAMILALCHSGSGKSQLPLALKEQISTMKGEFFAQPLHEVSSAMMILSASKWGQPAREDHNLRNDIYTHFLLQGLKRSDRNDDGAISLFEAHEFARSKTYDYTHGQQTPSALINIEGSDPIILNGQVRRQGDPLVFADSDGFRNLHMRVNGQSKGTLWQPKRLPEGRVHLSLYDPGNPDTPIMSHQVYLEANRSYSVSDLLSRPPQVALQTAVTMLPLPATALDMATSDLVMPGIGVQASDFWGTDLNGGVDIFMRESGNQTNIDYDTSKVTHQITAARIHVGYGHFPASHLRLSPVVALGYMGIERTFDNPSFSDRNQHLSVIYPELALSVHRFNLLGPIYASAHFGLVPANLAKIKVNGQSHQLSWFTGGLSTGVSF